jgi:hypothetical protein
MRSFTFYSSWKYLRHLGKQTIQSVMIPTLFLLGWIVFPMSGLVLSTVQDPVCIDLLEKKAGVHGYQPSQLSQKEREAKSTQMDQSTTKQ